MNKMIQSGAFAAALALVLAGCGSAPSAQSGSTSGTNGADVAGSGAAAGNKVCMVSDSGGFDDKSFNESGFEGLKKAETELGVEIASTESTSDADYIPNLNNMVQQNCNLIIGVGFLMADAMEEVAKTNPDIDFALIDASFKEPLPNAKSLNFNTAEAAYLAGYAAAGQTSTGKIGTFLGAKIATTQIFADGFFDGIAKYNEVHGTSVELLGWNKDSQDGTATGDFEDLSKGKQTATELINQGADIIMPVAGPVGGGALAAAKEAGNVSIVWVDADGYLTNEDYQSIILTSVMKEIGAAVFDTVKSFKDGAWSNEAYVGTLENKGVGIAPFHDFDNRVSPDLKKEIEGLQADITSGKITVDSPSAPKA